MELFMLVTKPSILNYFILFFVFNDYAEKKKNGCFHGSKNGQKNGPFFRVKTRLI